MLNHKQMQERNAHLMNTVPGTRVILSTTVRTPNMWIGDNDLHGYDGYTPMFGYFEFRDHKGEGLAISEDSRNWDFEVYDAQ